MFGSNTLEVAIGLAFLFFILSLVVTAAREMLEGWVQTRAVHLERGIRELLKDDSGTGLAKQIYGHPLINSLFRGQYDPAKVQSRWFGRSGDSGKKRYDMGSTLPAYIPARNFALALLDISARGSMPAAKGTGPVADTGPMTFQQIRAGVTQHITDPSLQRAVLVALDGAKGDLEQARANLEAWFDSGMDRVSGWYRRNTQWILFWMGLGIAFTLNVDTIRVAQTLYQNDAMRAAIVSEADAVVQRSGGNVPVTPAEVNRVLGCAAPSPVPPGGSAAPSCAQQRLEALPYPIGWEGRQVSLPWAFEWRLGQWLGSFPWGSIPGWLLTALALTLGAPFWFDLLNKMMIIRSTVKPHEKSPEESSEDRQASPRPPAPPAPAPAAMAAPAVAAETEDPEFQAHAWASDSEQEGDL